MAVITGQNVNSWVDGDTSNPPGIVLNSATFTQILAANPNRRVRFTISNPSPNDVSFKLALPSVPDVAATTPQRIHARTEYEEPSGQNYRGTVSAIAINGNPTVFVTEV